MHVNVVRRSELWDFLRFGVLSSTEKITERAYQSYLAVLELSTVLKSTKTGEDNSSNLQMQPFGLKSSL